MQVTKGKIKRGNSRKAIVFASIYLAFIQTDNPETHENLIRVFNLSRKTGLQGLKHVKLNMPKGHDVHLVHITPVHLIKDIMESFKANEEQKTEIIELYNDIKNRHTKLNRARPQSVAAGVTYYWICANKIGITLRDFSKKVNLSELTIGKMAKLISNIVKRSNEAAAAVAMVATTAAVSDP
jgi:transcription initiation factor TFIIIB Brf1 subunit/transcription initiation factor TFIIB